MVITVLEVDKVLILGILDTKQNTKIYACIYAQDDKNISTDYYFNG